MSITVDDHGGYVAGRYRDGSLSDGWTDVLRCAPGTFVRYVPRCACGWTGRERPASPAGSTACMQEWFLAHVVPLPARPDGRPQPDGRPEVRLGERPPQQVDAAVEPGSSLRA